MTRIQFFHRTQRSKRRRHSLPWSPLLFVVLLLCELNTSYSFLSCRPTAKTLIPHRESKSRKATRRSTRIDNSKLDVVEEKSISFFNNTIPFWRENKNENDSTTTSQPEASSMFFQSPTASRTTATEVKAVDASNKFDDEFQLYPVW